MLVDFCLPIKNESLILENSLNRLLSYCEAANFDFSWRIIGVVNGSNDASTDILREFKRRLPDKIDWMEISEPGRGRALKKYWLLSSADVLSYMDADLAVSLDNLEALVAPLINNEADVVIGSRLSAGSAIKRSLFREFFSRSYKLFSRLILKHRIDDLQCGFKAIRREAFLQVYPHLRDDYWFFDTELVILALILSLRVRQIPVDWQENRYQKRSSTVKIFQDSLFFIRDLVMFRHRLKSLKNFLTANKK